MCAMVFDPYGGPDVLCLRNVPLPEPHDGDVLIRVGYAGVNPANSKARSADLGVNWRYQREALIQTGSGWSIADMTRQFRLVGQIRRLGVAAQRPRAAVRTPRARWARP